MKIDVEALPMKEAEEFWEGKVRLSPGQFRRLADEAKLRAFAIAGIAKGDELETAFTAIQRAVAAGTTFADFKQDCAGIFERRGWTGTRAWRIDNIFRTNVQTAFNAGRYRQMKSVVKLRPYWMYSAVNDRRTRPTHRALHETVYPADHVFWNTWYPPNGFRCRCTVVTLSERQVKKRGLTVATDDRTGKLIEPIDPRTGNRLPARPLIPDRGFSFHPGKSVYGGITPAEGTGGYVDRGSSTYTAYKRRKLANLPAKAYGRYTEADLIGKELASEEYVAIFLKEFGFDLDGGVLTDRLGEPIVISDALFKDVDGNWKVKKAGRERYLRLLAAAIKDPYEIWLTPQQNRKTGEVILRKRFIKAFSDRPDDKITGFAAFDYHSKAGWEGVTAFTPNRLGYADRLRNGVLLYGKKA